MAENRELALVLKLVADQFQSELKKSQGALSGFNSFIKDWKTQLTAAGTALFAIAKSTANYGDELVKASQRMGTSVEETARLQHAAKLSDTDLQGLSKTVGFLAKEMLAASSGNLDAQKNFDRLGISVVGANGQMKGTTQILLEMNDKFRLMPEGPEKVALAMLTLGKTGKDVLPLLNSNMREAFEEAEKLGLVMSETAAKAAEHFNDELTKLQGAIRGVTNDVGTALIPKFDAISHALRTIIEDAHGAAKAIAGLGKSDVPQVGVVKPDGGGRNLRILPAPSGADKVPVDKFFPTEADEAHAAMLREIDRYQQNLQKKEIDIISKRTMEDLQLLFAGANSMRQEVQVEVDQLIRELMDDNARTIEQINRDFAGDTAGERQAAAGRRIVEQTQKDLAAQERDQLVQNLQAWVQYDEQVGASSAQRYAHQLDLVRANLAQQTQLTREESGRLLLAWQNHDWELAQQILARTTLTAQQKETIELQSLARVAAANEQTSDDLFAGWARGMERYVADTKSGFGMAADMARRTAQQMEQGFRNGFFDLFEGQIRSWKDVMRGMLDFVKQIAAQIAAQLATAFLLKSVMGGGGLFSGFDTGWVNNIGEFFGMNFTSKHNGGMIMAQRYSAGGHVFGAGNRDTVPALLTPGEGVLSRRGMAMLDQLNQGNSPASGFGNLTVNIQNAPAGTEAFVNQRRMADGVVLDVILRHRRDLGPLLGGA